MKKQKKTLLSIMLAASLGAAAFGGVAALGVFDASADAKTYNYTDVFGASGSAALSANATDSTKLSLTLPDGGSAYLKKRDLALKWYEKADEASYFSFEFALADKNFETISIIIESASAWATEDEMATNTVQFINTNGAVTVKVNDGEAKPVEDTALASTLKLALAHSDNYGEFDVTLNGASIGAFENVGANFAENTTDITPFTIKAELPEGSEEKTVVNFVSLNKQSLALNASGQFTDNAAPVLIVNDELNGFTLGTQYAVTAEAVDVLETSLTTTITYYQYNPTTEADKIADAYVTMPTTKPYLTETVYKGTDEKAHSVFDDEGAEFLSVKYTLKDESDASSVVELAWYANAVKKIGDVTYITMDRNEEGAEYTFLTKNADNTQTFTETQAYKDFVASLKAETEDENGDPVLVAGSETELLIPTLKGLISDNDGYSNLKFTICYRNVEGENTSSNLSASKLKLTLARAGVYEMKIFANDKAGHTMKYYLDGKEVEVSSSNIWDIEEIPTWSFEVLDKGLSIESETGSDREDTETIDSNYSISDVNVLGDGASDCSKEFMLFKVDVTKFTGTATNALTESMLSDVTYSGMQAKAESGLGAALAAGEDYLDFFKKVYLECLAEKMGGTSVDALLDSGVFTEIQPFDSRIDEDKHESEWAKNNKYNWNATNGTFTTAEEGVYLMIGVYSDAEIASDKVSAYKVIIAEDEEDIIKGETEWLKNNLVSVILFGVAGVMLILIIILLFVKPSDETVEDVGTAAKKQKKNKSK